MEKILSTAGEHTTAAEALGARLWVSDEGPNQEKARVRPVKTFVKNLWERITYGTCSICTGLAVSP